MYIDRILIRHWINNPEIKINSNWKIDKTYRPYSGTMYVTDIKNSIHYLSVIGNEFSDYNLLVKSTGQKEHSEEKFKKLISEFSENELETHKIKINENNIVIDGTHRLSILVSKNPDINKLNDKWIEIEK